MRKGGTTSANDRDTLSRLRSRPKEARWNNASLCRLRVDGLVAAAPLERPSGRPSAYREWTITELGIELLQEEKS